MTACAHEAALIYLDELTMRCTACNSVLQRAVGVRAYQPPPDPEERIADALESIARSLRKIAYPDQYLIEEP